MTPINKSPFTNEAVMNYKSLIFLVLVSLPLLAVAGNIDKTHLIKAPALPYTADENTFIKFNPGTPLNPQAPMDDPLQVGTTYYDFVNYGSLSKTVALDDFSWVHFAWTNGLNSSFSYRHIFYNITDQTNWPLGTSGVQAWASDKSGFCCLDVLSSGKAVIAAHSTISTFPDYPTTIACDYFAHWGAFMYVFIQSAVEHDTIIWPHMAVDYQDNVYVFSREMGAEDYSFIYHSFSADSATTFSRFEFADTVNVPSFTVATSRISGRAAFGYHQFLEDYLNHPQWSGFLAMQINNDAMVVIKEEGQDWDFTNPINITNIIKADPSLLPDTVMAQGDTFRAYLDIDLMFDNDDILHAMFTTRGLWEAPWSGSSPPISGLIEGSILWHWREDTEELSVVANGWWHSASNVVSGGAGAWKSTYCRPSMGIDEEGNLYCVFEGYHDFEGPTPDTSSIAMGNGDVFVTVSQDGGYNWAEATNLTNTHSNGASSGQCMSECFPCLAEEVDDYLHIFYMEDKDAGSVVFQEGAATLNPMWYFPLDKTEVPAYPLVEQINFHIYDSSAVNYQPRINPSDFSLNGNYPNPFNNATSIDFTLNKAMNIKLKVYDVQGRLVGNLAQGYHSSGKHSVVWGAQGLSSGLYLAELSAGGVVKTCKMMLLK